MFGIPSSSQRGSKISNIMQALSKYDAKYAKPSSLVQDDSSDDMKDKEASTSEKSVSGKQIYIGDASTHPDLSININKPQGKPQEHSPPTAGTSLSPTLVKRVKGRIYADSEEEILNRKSSLSVEENDFLKTASSMDSIKTDSSAAGFNNIHSVSSLADSVLPLDDVLEDTLPAFTTFNPPKDNSLVTDEENKEDNLVISSSTDLSKSVMISALPGAESKNGMKTGTKSRIDEDCHISQETTENHSIRISSKCTPKSITSNLLGHQPKNAFLQKCTCRISDNGGTKSVAVQTSTYFASSVDSKRQAPMMELSDDKYEKGIPVFKPTKLPCFLKQDDSAAAFNLKACIDQNKKSQDKMTSPFEIEISHLVSQHLLLVKDFLERQHRMYLANCKAVQLLERGYKQDGFLCSKCQVFVQP